MDVVSSELEGSRNGLNWVVSAATGVDQVKPFPCKREWPFLPGPAMGVAGVRVPKRCSI
ncbi:hypothetical protein J2Y57_003667 [Sphingomonas sp. BE137]|jgi:hypothetical protein|nr:hypothetical protein [Sphingomonas sp. BE137]